MFEDVPVILFIALMVIFGIVRAIRNGIGSLVDRAGRGLATRMRQATSAPPPTFDAPRSAPPPATMNSPWGGIVEAAPPPRADPLPTMPDITMPEVKMPEPTGPVFRFKTADEIIRDAFGKVTVLSGDIKPDASGADRS